MKEPKGTLFPVAAEGADDRRFLNLARDVGRVLEQHAYPRVNGDDRVELAAKLFEFLYVSRGAAGEMEKRINGVCAPLVSDEGGLDAYDCVAVAHEVRRKRGAQGALVLAMDEKDHIHIGCAVAPQSQADFAFGRLLAALDELGTAQVEPIVLDLVINEERPS